MMECRLTRPNFSREEIATCSAWAEKSPETVRVFHNTGGQEDHVHSVYVVSAHCLITVYGTDCVLYAAGLSSGAKLGFRS